MVDERECGEAYNKILCKYQDSISNKDSISKGEVTIIGDKKSNFFTF